jgi:hypothetical protein
MVTANNNTMGRKNILNENSFHTIPPGPLSSSPSPINTDFVFNYYLDGAKCH